VKKGRYRGRCSVTVNLKSTERVALYLGKIRRIARVDSQGIRAKLLRQLDALFNLAFSIAKGQVKRLRDDEGKEYSVTLGQRQKWARLAAYTAQVMQNLSKGFDEKEFQTDLKKLEQMVNEIRRKKAAEDDRAVV
jgi:hypothetical protein